MKRTCLLGIALLALGWLFIAAGGDTAATHDRVNLDRFVATHIQKTAAPPFAFTYGGKQSSEFLAKWALPPETRAAGDKTTETIVYRDPATKLRVTAVYTLYPDFPAAEWVLHRSPFCFGRAPTLSLTFSNRKA